MRLPNGRFWGMVRPGENGVDQEIEIQRRDGDDWDTVTTHRVTDAHGYFSLRLPDAPRDGHYRFVWDGMASPPAVSR
jgi:hypothetical protein